MAWPLSGPGGQTGRGTPGQYVYWICMARPMQAALVAKPGMKTPVDFTKLDVTVHSGCGVELEEVSCFLEPQANGQPHLNALVRSLRQYRWKSVAEALLNGRSVYVSFGKTFALGLKVFCTAGLPQTTKEKKAWTRTPHSGVCMKPFSKQLWTLVSPVPIFATQSPALVSPCPIFTNENDG